MKLRESLSERGPDLYARFLVIESKARQFLEYSQGGSHLTFTPHGLSHVSAVEENYDWLLSEDDIQSFHPFEVFCLLCATLFHDAAMVPPRQGLEPKTRASHAELALKFLTKLSAELGINLHEADVISEVIHGHSVMNLAELTKERVIGNTLIDIRKLAACLSLADICHADTSRAPEIVLRYLEMDEDSFYHWRRHLQISGITRKNDFILISSIHFSDDGLKAIEDFKKEVEQQLEIIKPYFQSVLSPILSVELQSKRLKSQLDVPIRFQANTRAILDILIEGVYERPDVFLREIVQNSLDACHLRMAKAIKRNEPYHSRIVISQLVSHGVMQAIRIDDNGLGMDISDVQDTVLWIGNTIADRKDVRDLLAETTKKDLIATFGIGLLSCFKSCENITVRSKKDNYECLEFSISSINDEIRPHEAKDVSEGTTIILTIKSDILPELIFLEALKYYFRQVRSASIEILILTYDEKTLNMSRTEVMKIATTEAVQVKPIDHTQLRPYLCVSEIKGEDFFGWLAIPRKPSSSDDDYIAAFDEGKVTILCEGIFVTEDNAGSWLPKHFRLCNGILNFSAKAVDLPVSRDRVVRNKKMTLKIQEIEKKGIALVNSLVEMSSDVQVNDAKRAVIMIAALYEDSSDTWKKRIIQNISGLKVKEYRKRERSISVSDLVNNHPDRVYLSYSRGRWVEDLTTVDGKLLYHKPDDLTDLQAALFRQEGKIVLSTDRADPSDRRILEAQLLKAFFTHHGIPTTDLTKGDVSGGRLRSQKVPRHVRDEISGAVKFVDIPQMPNKRGWCIENKAWLNIAHPEVRHVYDLLHSHDIPDEQLCLAQTIVKLLAFNFEDGINDLFILLSGGNNVRI